jgi:alpha-glucosidase
LDCPSGTPIRTNISELILDIYPGNGQYIHYVDDGESYNYRNGEYTLYEFSINSGKETSISINRRHNGYKGYENFKIIYNSIAAKEVYFNDIKIQAAWHDNFIDFKIPADNGVIRIV